MSTESGLYAECWDCKWKSDDPRTARNAARKHAKDHGHRTIAKVTRYCNGRKDKKEPK